MPFRSTFARKPAGPTSVRWSDCACPPRLAHIVTKLLSGKALAAGLAWEIDTTRPAASALPLNVSAIGMRTTGRNCRWSFAMWVCSCRSLPKPKLTLKNGPPYIPAPFPPGARSRLAGRLLVRSVELQTTRFPGPDAAKVMSMRRPELQGRLSSDSSSNEQHQQISVKVTAAGTVRAKQPFTRERPCRAINTRCESAGY